MDAAAQRHVNIRLHRAFVVQIDDANLRVLLAKTVNTADALLDAHGVPRHVVIDERAAKLEVQTFGGGVGAKQHVGLAGAELALGLLAGNGAPASVFLAHFTAAPGETHHAERGLAGEFFAQEIHRVRVLGEHHRLRIAVGAEFLQLDPQAFGLGIRR
jgi:hypothetical protein